MPTHYETLGVPIEADTEAIRRAYVTVAKANHPDRRQSDDASRRARAEERIRAANAAWHVLRDPERRADYDRTLRLAQTRFGSEVRRRQRLSHGCPVGRGNRAAVRPLLRGSSFRPLMPTSGGTPRSWPSSSSSSGCSS